MPQILEIASASVQTMFTFNISPFGTTVILPIKPVFSTFMITRSRPTVMTYGALYWWTPNIPTIRKAIWMKLAMIGAHINPRKSKTCRSTTTSYKKISTENTLLAFDEWQSLFVILKEFSTLSWYILISWSEHVHVTSSGKYAEHSLKEAQHKLVIRTSWRTKMNKRMFLPWQQPMTD